MQGRKEYMTKVLCDEYDERTTRRKGYVTEGRKYCMTEEIHGCMTDGPCDGRVGKERRTEVRKERRKEGSKE
jgi:hypothetical protein